MDTEIVKTALRVLSLTDLTRLNSDDSESGIISFCHDMASACQKLNPVTYPVAICVYPEYVTTAMNTLSQLGITSMLIATVINFPSGDSNASQAVEQVQFAINQGADEIDLVFPYKHYLAGDKDFAARLISQCKAVCPDPVKLKVIIETGELKTYEHIYEASRMVIDAGADFVKTSTGKVPVNATLPAAEAILQAIRDSGHFSCGFKASGGIQTVQEAVQYLRLAEKIMGENWITPAHFRFGASSLLSNVIAILTTNNVSVQ